MKKENDLKKHVAADEDVRDRLKVKKAIKNGQFVEWEDANQSLAKKHGLKRNI